MSHLEPSQHCMYPDSGGFIDDILCVECNIDIMKPIECTICDAELQVRLKQCGIVNEKPIDCTCYK